MTESCLNSCVLLLQRDEVDPEDHDEGSDEPVFVELFFEEHGGEEEDRHRAYACHRVDLGGVCLGERGVQESCGGGCAQGCGKHDA